MARNNSTINSPTFAHSISDHGLTYNTKNCWESVEDHFVCLDKSNDVYDNHLKCERTYNTWISSCPALVRKNQMIRRGLIKDDRLLYTDQASLDKYNSEKNKITPYYAHFNPTIQSHTFE